MTWVNEVTYATTMIVHLRLGRDGIRCHPGEAGVIHCADSTTE